MRSEDIKANMAWFFLVSGVLLLLGKTLGAVTYNVVIPLIFVFWGVAGFLHKKFEIKDGNYLIYGILLAGLSVYGYFEILDNANYEQDGLLTALSILLLGAVVLIFNGIKSHLANIKIDKEY
jgi:hypothetical protein